MKYINAISLITALLSLAIAGWLIWTLRAGRKPVKRKIVDAAIYILIALIVLTVLLLISGALLDALQIIT